MIDVKKIGQRVRALRRRAGLSQQALADLANVHVNTLSVLERGDAENIGVQKLDEIGAALGERIDVLIRRAKAVGR